MERGQEERKRFCGERTGGDEECVAVKVSDCSTVPLVTTLSERRRLLCNGSFEEHVLLLSKKALEMCVCAAY